MFLHFERGEYINEEDLPKITNYICRHLISWSPCRSYFECQHNYITKLKIVCRCIKKQGLPTCSKKGEAIYDDKLINFFEDKQHEKCICSTV